MAPSSQQDALIPDTLGGCKLLHPNDKCHACSAKPADYKLSKCSRCNWALYCDATCQKSHWEIHKPECKFLRSNPKDLQNGCDHTFDHVREVVECIRRAGLQWLVKDLCVSEMVRKSTGETLSWMFEEAIDRKDFTNKCWACKRDH